MEKYEVEIEEENKKRIQEISKKLEITMNEIMYIIYIKVKTELKK